MTMLHSAADVAFLDDSNLEHREIHTDEKHECRFIKVNSLTRFTPPEYCHVQMVIIGALPTTPSPSWRPLQQKTFGI